MHKEIEIANRFIYNMHNGYYVFIYIHIYLYIVVQNPQKHLYKWGGAVQNDGARAARSSSQTQLKIYRLGVANRSQLAGHSSL